MWRGNTLNLEYILRSYESPKKLLKYIEQTIKFHLFNDFKGWINFDQDKWYDVGKFFPKVKK